MTFQRILNTWGSIGFYSVDITDGPTGPEQVAAITTQLKAQGELPEAMNVTGVLCTPRDYGTWDTWVTDAKIPYHYTSVYYRLAFSA